MTEFPETADIETASEDYASRFSSRAGQWMLAEQARHLRAGLQHLSAESSILDVGGGHAQTAIPLAEDGHHVTVTGSDAACACRLPEDGSVDFRVADHLHVPYPDRSFDATISFRLLPHCGRWQALIAELCRCADHYVVVDYPTSQSLNVIADALFGLKKKVEKNTRPFTLFHHRDIKEAFAANGFRIVQRRAQFFWPMVIHRMLNRPGVSQALELLPRCLGATALLGSPIVLVAERVAQKQPQHDHAKATRRHTGSECGQLLIPNNRTGL